MQRFRHTDKTPASGIIRISGLIIKHPFVVARSPPPDSQQPVTSTWVPGSVLMWWIAFPQGLDFHHLLSMNLSRHACVHQWQTKVFSHRLTRITLISSIYLFSFSIIPHAMITTVYDDTTNFSDELRGFTETRHLHRPARSWHFHREHRS